MNPHDDLYIDYENEVGKYKFYNTRCVCVIVNAQTSNAFVC